MPRLSLYRPERGNDYKFIDKQVYEMFQIGGTDVYVHKYIGPVDPSDPNKAMGETTIQDVLFLENRDRKYDSTIYNMRGVYNVQDIDFNLSQFGLFLQNDTIFMTVHINNTVETLGRKIISGDVLELPHLKDDHGLNNLLYSLKRFYVVEDINRAAEGFSITWYPHLYRLKLKPIMDTSEFKDILDRPLEEDKYAGDYVNETTYYPGQIIKYNGTAYEVIAETTGNEPPNSTYFRQLNESELLRFLMSTYSFEKNINNSILAEAEANAPLSGYDTRNFYTLQTNDRGEIDLITVDNSNVALDDANTADSKSASPSKEGYQGYLLGDGIPTNGAPYGFGIRFPENAAEGDFFLRTDYLPNRLFRFDGRRWIKYEDSVRMTLSMTDDRQTQKTSFINNTEYFNIDSVYTDTFRIKDPMVFRPDDLTASIDLMSNKIITRVDYNQKYGLEAFLNEQVLPVISIINEDGKLAFITNSNLMVGDTVRWTIYNQRLKQRVALSSALRPRADL